MKNIRYHYFLCLLIVLAAVRQVNAQQQPGKHRDDSLRVIQLLAGGDADLLTKVNLELLGTHLSMLTTNSRLFTLCQTDPARVDSIVHNPDYAAWVTAFLIRKDVIRPEESNAKAKAVEPDWNMIAKKIERKFGASNSADLVVDAKVDWYRYKKNGARYARYLVQQTGRLIKRNQVPPNWMGAFGLNNAAWEVFQYSTNKRELATALSWMNLTFKIDGQPTAEHLDTRANLLYKLGRRPEAIQLEQQALGLSPQDKNILETKEKMLQGQATWPDHMQ